VPEFSPSVRRLDSRERRDAGRTLAGETHLRRKGRGRAAGKTRNEGKCRANLYRSARSAGRATKSDYTKASYLMRRVRSLAQNWHPIATGEAKGVSLFRGCELRARLSQRATPVGIRQPSRSRSLPLPLAFSTPLACLSATCDIVASNIGDDAATQP
jgi:hypothetical protein